MNDKKEEIVNKMVTEYIKDLHDKELNRRKVLIEKIIDPNTIPKEVQLIKVNCIRCKHGWYIRKNTWPRMCPECNSIYWNSLYDWELGYEYFGKRVYAYCRQCGKRAVKNGFRIRRNGDLMIAFICQDCHVQSRINFTTDESDMRPVTRSRGRQKFISKEMQEKIRNKRGRFPSFNIMLVEVLPYAAELEVTQVYPKV